MLTLLTDLPDHVVGVEATAHVSKAEYENVLLPAIDALAERTDKIYFLYVVKTGLDHFSAGAMWDDLKVGLQHFSQWKRIAVVSDNKVIKNMTNFFSFALPAHVKGFSLDRLEEAKKWVAIE